MIHQQQAGSSSSQLHLQHHAQLHQHYEEMKHELGETNDHELGLSSNNFGFIFGIDFVFKCIYKRAEKIVGV